MIFSNRSYFSTTSDRKGKIITCNSSKGGVGKTLISLNMSAYFSNLFKLKNLDKKVLLIDYNLQFGDLSYLSNIKPVRTIADLNDISDIDSDALESHLYEHPQGFYLLSCPKTPEYANYITPETLTKIIIIAKRLFDYVIIDTMTGLDQASTTAIEHSDMTIFVTSGKLPSLKSTKFLIDLYETSLEDNFKDKVKLLVSKTDKYCIPTDEIKKRFAYEVVGSIEKNENVVFQSENYEKIISIDFPSSDIGKDMIFCFNNILGKFSPNTFTEDKKEVVKKKGIMGKLFSK